MIALDVVVIVLLTLASAFTSCAEIAFFSLSSSRIKSYRTDLNPKKRHIAKLLQNSMSLLVTIFMLNTIVNVLLQNRASGLFDQFHGGWILKVGFPLVLVLLFGELLPKYFGLLYNEKLAPRFVDSLAFLHRIVTPLRVGITSLSSFLSRALFFFLRAEPPLSKEQLEYLLESSEGQGLLHKDEAELILGVLSLEEKQVKDLMLPKSSMPLYHIDEPLSKLVHLFSEHKVEKIPVFKMPEEKLLGIISALDLFIHRRKIEDAKSLVPYLKQPLFVPETSSAQSLLEQLAKRDITSAIVIDEYGSTTGMIGELDLVKQIVRTRKKVEPREAAFKRVAKNAIVAQGTMSLDDVASLFEVKLDSMYHSVTIGGWLTEQLGTIPQSGQTFEYATLFFRILSADPTKVRKVYIQPKEDLK